MDKQKRLFISELQDSVNDLLYYDRKNDEELSYEDVEQLFATGELHPDDVVEEFKHALYTLIETNYGLVYEEEE
jgi:hypothetical protein